MNLKALLAYFLYKNKINLFENYILVYEAQKFLILLELVKFY